MPVAARETANTRLSALSEVRCARWAPIHAAPAFAGAMHAHIGKLMLPSCAASPELDANAATIVAGAPTITPAAAARPMLLCIDTPDKVMTMFVIMPPPTPAKPETESNCYTGDVPPIPAWRLVQDRPKTPGGGEAHGNDQAECGKDRDQNAASEMRGRELPDDHPRSDARPPFAQERKIGVTGSPVSERGHNCRRQNCR